MSYPRRPSCLASPSCTGAVSTAFLSRFEKTRNWISLIVTHGAHSRRITFGHGNGKADILTENTHVGRKCLICVFPKINRIAIFQVALGTACMPRSILRTDFVAGRLAFRTRHVYVDSQCASAQGLVSHSRLPSIECAGPTVARRSETKELVLAGFGAAGCAHGI
jgi:hypothetical protein